MLDRITDRHRQAAAGAQHAPHLAQGGGTVFEEHQAELAHDRVEAGAREGQRLRAAVVPFDVRALAPGYREHLRVGIEPLHPAAGETRSATATSAPVPHATSSTR